MTMMMMMMMDNPDSVLSRFFLTPRHESQGILVTITITATTTTTI